MLCDAPECTCCAMKLTKGHGNFNPNPNPDPYLTLLSNLILTRRFAWAWFAFAWRGKQRSHAGQNVVWFRVRFRVGLRLRVRNVM